MVSADSTWWRSSDCDRVINNECVTNIGPGNHENCLITAVQDLYIEQRYFSTEEFWDYISVNGIQFSGYGGMQGYYMPAGTVMQWSSDGTVTSRGWQLCARGSPTGYAAPPAPPPENWMQQPSDRGQSWILFVPFLMIPCLICTLMCSVRRTRRVREMDAYIGEQSVAVAPAPVAVPVASVVMAQPIVAQGMAVTSTTTICTATTTTT